MARNNLTALIDSDARTRTGDQTLRLWDWTLTLTVTIEQTRLEHEVNPSSSVHTVGPVCLIMFCKRNRANGLCCNGQQAKTTATAVVVSRAAGSSAGEMVSNYQIWSIMLVQDNADHCRQEFGPQCRKVQTFYALMNISASSEVYAAVHCSQSRS